VNKTNVIKGRTGKLVRRERVAKGQTPQQRWDDEAKEWVKL
jgi:hypothetical protein